MVDVFISYSRSDLAAVTRLAEAVEAEATTCGGMRTCRRT